MSELKLTEEESLDMIKQHKDNIIRRVRFKADVEADKKATAAAYRDQLKEINKEIEEELVKILELEDHLRDLTTDELLKETNG